MKQRGDTIIEVLIATVVISLVLAGAFVVSRNSTTAVRNAQEDAQASKIIESQIERLRAFIIDGGSIPAVGFCVDQSIQVRTNLATDCIFDQNGLPVGASAVRYEVQIVEPDASDPGKYQISVDWNKANDKIGSQKLYYRMEQP